MTVSTGSTFTDYTPGGAGSGSSAGSGDAKQWSLDRCKKAYTDYLSTKREEIEEQQEARRYRHGAQWTPTEVAALKKRRQPVVTFNRIGRKIAGVIGLIERLRQDPKAFPRTPKHEDGADLATAVLMYVLDQQDWKAKSPMVAEDGAVDGIGGVELNLVQGDSEDSNDRDVELDVVEPDSFFYDPRSVRLDFSDARYMGTGKWVDLETAKEMFPDKADELDQSVETGAALTSNSDRESKWFNSDSDGLVKKIRLVDIWYKYKGEWVYTLFTGSLVMMEGPSYLQDEKHKAMCKYIMFSGNVDHDGDRYGFVRDQKSAQDEINHRRSKALHILNSRRLIMTQSAVQDVETARREWARPDGVIIANSGQNVNESVKADDQSQDFVGQLKMLENATAEIENFGPNPALIGQGIENKSGRAIALLQQAGIAELGPYILAYRGWKIRVYRAIWNAVQQHWTGERWVRVTDDDNVAQFIQINGIGTDQNGMPAIVNAVGSLDVDIILDEGPDHVNMMADAYEAISALAPSIAPMMSPAEAKVMFRLLIETAPLQSSLKKQFKDQLEQEQQQPPDPMQEQAKQIALAGEAAKVKKTGTESFRNMADAMEKMGRTFAPPAAPTQADNGRPMQAPPGAGMPMMPPMPGMM